MKDETPSDAGPASRASTRAPTWNYHPPLPLTGIPVFVWPPRPLAALRWLMSLGFLGSVLIPFATLATITWVYLQPALERCVRLEPGWIVEMYARNLGLMLLIAGGIHMFFYVRRQQGAETKYDPRDLATDNRKFFTGSQVRDNMFWSCASGVTIWTAYEVGFMWAYANDLLPFFLDWRAHPFWFMFMFVFVIFWSSLHFYFVHRLLHWKPLYRIAHALHHRNDNVGPWSGLSMHPIEHLIYLSSVLAVATVSAVHLGQLPVHGHDHSGTAVAALGAVHLGQSGLHRVVAVLPVPDAFHRLQI